MYDLLLIREVVFFLLIFMLAGCSPTRSTEMHADGERIFLDAVSDLEKQEAREKIIGALQRGLAEYKLSRGDTIELIYHLLPGTEIDDYLLRMNDVLEIEFFYHPDMNRTVIIRPDGKITLPYKGDFVAAKMRPSDLAAAIENRFDDTLKDPKVTVNVKAFASKVSDFKMAILNDRGGLSKAFTIIPDGTIHPPFLSAVKASAMTVDQLRVNLNKRYQEVFQNVEISVHILSISGKRIFVLGEVGKPGEFVAMKPTTVLQAISRAGGILPTGSMGNVKVVYFSSVDNSPRVRTINLLNVVNKNRFEEDMVLSDNNVVFVPPTSITKMNRFMDHYIKKLFLFNGVSIGFSYELHSETKFR